MIFQIPLQTFPDGVQEQTVNVSIESNSYVFYFQNNLIEGNLFLSVFGSDQNPIYFGGYRCVFGNYINFIDNGFPYLIYFIDTTNNEYQNITFQTLNTGVNVYVQSRD